MHKNQQIMKIRQIQRNKIYDTLVKSVNGLPERSSHQCSSLSKSTLVFQVVNVSVLVPKDSSAFTEAILLERSKAIWIVKLI